MKIFVFLYENTEKNWKETRSPFLNICPSSRDFNVQRNVKWHQKWFTKVWPIIETLVKTAKFVTSTGLNVNK